MERGIANISIIPVRKEASDRSEMVTQLLYGETYTIESKTEKWVEIKVDHDDYIGWIDLKQHTTCNTDFTTKINTTITYDVWHPLQLKNEHSPIVIGSKLYNFDGINCKTFNGQKATYNGLAVVPTNFSFSIEKLVKTTNKYLNAPYLWGGRSPFGIDCSGFTQIVFQFFNVWLPRDASQQANIGAAVGFVQEAKPGDLAFFDRPEDGHITHVGIVLEDKKIIHASGKVKIDRLDHHGIFNETLQKYTHTLRIIKRVL